MVRYIRVLLFLLTDLLSALNALYKMLAMRETNFLLFFYVYALHKMMSVESNCHEVPPFFIIYHYHGMKRYTLFISQNDRLKHECKLES